MRGCILTIKSKGRSGVCGATIGAEGSGETGFVIHGDPEAAHAWAVEYVRAMERAGHRIESATVVRSDLDTYSGQALEVVSLDDEYTLYNSYQERDEARRLQRNVLRQACDWLDYAADTHADLTFDNFVGEFGYQGKDAIKVFELVTRLLGVTYSYLAECQTGR